ncbi:THAP domain-containing protein 4 isoform X2 [Cephus cinctus]|uniref:THAP domain-containing protein 4 isoform X2 n=1 Tax=Cephus cinctus TaxID=211228 RepID=A0AAJ7RAM3_CEPCN|nr:THAP domain-containing protein 4 isoform X2 [Cephus cinctus]
MARSIGQPMFNYVAQSWHPEKKTPMHRETGFLKVIPGTNKVSLLLAHNFGLTTIEEGEIGDNEIVLKSSSITRLTMGCKDPAVVKISRKFKLIGEKLHHTVYMATTTTTKETEHLQAVYTKQTAIV